MRGTVRRLLAEKGFGFVRPDEAGLPDYFFHRSQVDFIASGGRTFDQLKEGTPVDFEVDAERQERGPRCKSLKFAEPPEQSVA